MSKYKVVTIDYNYNAYIVNADSESEAIEKVITRLICGDSLINVDKNNEHYIEVNLVED